MHSHGDIGVVMAETLASGSELIEMLWVCTLGVEMAATGWRIRPFMDLVRDREVLTAFWRGWRMPWPQANASEKGKTIKGVINDCLTGENGREPRRAMGAALDGVPARRLHDTRRCLDGHCRQTCGHDLGCDGASSSLTVRLCVQFWQAHAGSLADCVNRPDIERAHPHLPNILASDCQNRTHPRPRQWL
jgi:hypothetical protein